MYNKAKILKMLKAKKSELERKYSLSELGLFGSYARGEESDQYTEDYSFSDFEGDAKTRHAVERNFEIIGEAASRLSAKHKALTPHISAN